MPIVSTVTRNARIAVPMNEPARPSNANARTGIADGRCAVAG
jgi:hypothetical protein